MSERYDTEHCAEESGGTGDRFDVAAKPAAEVSAVPTPSVADKDEAPGPDTGMPAAEPEAIVPEVLPPAVPERMRAAAAKIKIEIGAPENGPGPVPAEPASPADGSSAVAKAEVSGSAMMAVGEIRFGVTATGEPIGKSHWLADSSVCGDLVMALPSSVLIAGRTEQAGGVAVDMSLFLDAVIEGTGRLLGIAGIAESASLPAWAVSRLFGTFPALRQVYDEAMDQAAMAVEAAAFKAAIGMNVKCRRTFKKDKKTPDGHFSESSDEEIEKYIPPDPTLSRAILTSRMKGRYKNEGESRQAVQINIMGPEANL